MDEPELKKCTVCKKVRKIEDFYVRRRKGVVIGRVSRCRFCASAQATADNVRRYREDPEFRARKRQYDADRHARRMKNDPTYREQIRNRALLQSYGITEKDFQKMLKRQKGRCAICSYKPDPKDKRPRWRTLEVDHCHRTGKVRGLLCRRCNDALGKFEDDPKLLKRALAFVLS